MAGMGFVFISYKGEVKPCGYFDLVLDNVRNKPLDKIYLENEHMNRMRNPENLKQACEMCNFNRVCGGCRARAYAVNGDYMSEDPNCDLATGQF